MKSGKMLLFAINFLTLLTLSVRCNEEIKIKDPLYTEFSKYDYNRGRMFSAMSLYTQQEECKPIRAFFVTRHGAKYPSDDILDDISTKLVPKIQEKLKELYADKTHENFIKLQKNQQKIISGIIKWTNVMASGTHKDINENGKRTMLDLGMRLKEKLKNLTETLKKEEIEVLAAEEDRCVISGQKMLRTFYGEDSDDIIVKANTYGDERLELVKPDENKVKVNPDNKKKPEYVEDYFFRKNVPQLRTRIQKLLFPDHIKDYIDLRAEVTDSMVKTMYYACAHSSSHHNPVGELLDNWCHLFRFEDLQLFEDMQDLQYYYKNGYHLEENVKLGNAMAGDMLKFLKSPGMMKFKLFVGHTSNCLSILTRFNLFRDNTKLTYENIKEMKHRKWRTSYMVPFACNIMLVVYDCGHRSLKVSIYINEVPLEMVLDGKYTCIKCPIDKIQSLLESFNTGEIPQPKPHTPEDLDKKHAKKLKLHEKQLQQQIIKNKMYDKQEEQRQKEAFSDNDEEYFDENERLTHA